MQGGYHYHDQGGHFNGDGFNFIDMACVRLPDRSVSIDHIITPTGTVMVRVNGTFLRHLPTEPTHHCDFDETRGVRAGGF